MSPRHGEGVSLYMTGLSDKQARKIEPGGGGGPGVFEPPNSPAYAPDCTDKIPNVPTDNIIIKEINQTAVILKLLI